MYNIHIRRSFIRARIFPGSIYVRGPIPEKIEGFDGFCMQVLQALHTIQLHSHGHSRIDMNMNMDIHGQVLYTEYMKLAVSAVARGDTDVALSNLYQCIVISFEHDPKNGGGIYDIVAAVKSAAFTMEVYVSRAEYMPALQLGIMALKRVNLSWRTVSTSPALMVEVEILLARCTSVFYKIKMICASANASAIASATASANASVNASSSYASANASSTASANASANATANASAIASSTASANASAIASATASANASAIASANASANASAYAPDCYTNHLANEMEAVEVLFGLTRCAIDNAAKRLDGRSWVSNRSHVIADADAYIDTDAEIAAGAMLNMADSRPRDSDKDGLLLAVERYMVRGEKAVDKLWRKFDPTRVPASPKNESVTDKRSRAAIHKRVEIVLPEIVRKNYGKKTIAAEPRVRAFVDLVAFLAFRDVKLVEAQRRRRNETKEQQHQI